MYCLGLFIEVLFGVKQIHKIRAPRNDISVLMKVYKTCIMY